MSNQISKTDVTDSEFLDAEELSTDGSFVYLTTGVVSTTAGTQTVVVSLPSDGEGILYSKDHPANPGDIVVITGTSGGLGNGTFTIATIPTDLSFTVVEAIGTSTGGSVDFHYVPGAENIGFDLAGQNTAQDNDVQNALTEVANASLLDDDPVSVDTTYVVTRVNNRVTKEEWTNDATTFAIKSIDYTYANNHVTQEIRKIYAASDGVTVIAQTTIVYTYQGNIVTGSAITRDI